MSGEVRSYIIEMSDRDLGNWNCRKAGMGTGSRGNGIWPRPLHMRAKFATRHTPCGRYRLIFLCVLLISIMTRKRRKV